MLILLKKPRFSEFGIVQVVSVGKLHPEQKDGRNLNKYGMEMVKDTTS